jgi:hypothetical protein
VRAFTKKITQKELWDLIEDASAGCRYGHYTCLTPQVEKDLSKVQFDTENIEVSDCQTLSNGLSFVGISSGGDWEWPIFFIIYYDGKKLRGYIPRDGNLWNTKTKQAYGNDDSDYMNGTTPVDIADAKKRGFLDANDPCQEIDCASMKRDMVKIRIDIENRIRFTG